MARRANRQLESKAETLDENGKTPLYRQIYAFLKSNILDGEYANGSLLPSEVQLAAAFGVSRITAKRALDKIAEDKYAVRSRGLGTRVRSESAPTTLVGSLQSLVDSRLARSGDTRRLVSFGAEKATVSVAVALKVPRGTLVHHAERICELQDGRPYAFLTTYIPLPIARFWSAEDFLGNTVMRLLLRAHVPIQRAEQKFSALTADRRVADLLAVKPGAALLKVERILYSAKDKPIEYFVGLYPSEHSQYSVALVGEFV